MIGDPLTTSDTIEAPDIETSSDRYADRFSGAIGSWFLKVQEEATLRMLASYQGVRILDVGGGHGQVTNALIENGFEVTVLGSADVCERRIQCFVEEKRCSFRVGNILDLPYRDRAFEVVLSYRLLPHVLQWRKLIPELTRVARWAVIVDYPTLCSLNYFARALFSWKKRVEGNTRPFACFRERELLETFRSNGFLPADRFAEFVLPMALHRMVNAASLSSMMESLARHVGITRLFGSPVIAKLVRDNG